MGINDSNIQALQCPDLLKHKIAAYCAEMIEVLGNDLVGVYLYGSLARGCYHSAASDVDIIVVTRGQCKELDTSAILQVHRNVGVPIDPVFITEAQLRIDAFPTQVLFLVKPTLDYKNERIVYVPEGRGDFLLQRQDVYEAGVALVGALPKDQFNSVPWPLLAQSLDYLFPYIVSHFKNPALMLCRIAHAWTHHNLSSKKQAGEWATEALGGQWSPVINTALAEYANGVTNSIIPATTLSEFEDFCSGYINDLRT